MVFVIFIGSCSPDFKKSDRQTLVTISEQLTATQKELKLIKDKLKIKEEINETINQR